jgi:hypothetical protein
MKPMTRLLVLLTTILLAGVTACQIKQFPTLIMYESPTRFVRLEADPSVSPRAGHSHPVSLTTEEMAAVLSGLMIEEPSRIVSFLDTNPGPPRHPAFNEAEVRFFAPLLAKGLGLATPEEVITFYQTSQDTAIIRKVTSGGMFVSGEELHVVLSNYRSSTHYASDPGVADTMDDRLTPMRSIAPQQVSLDFEPSSARVPARKNGLTSLFDRERQEIVILFKTLAPAKAGAGHRPNRGLIKEQ